MSQSLSKSKLLFLTPTLNGGGAEKNLINIINSLDINVFDIELVIFGGNDKYLTYLENNIKVTHYNLNDVKSGFFKLIKTLSTSKPDLVFATAFHVQFFLICSKILGKKFKMIYRVPTLPSNKLSTSFKGKLLNSMSSIILKSCDWVICQTNEMRSEVIKYWNLEAQKVITIRNLVNLNQLKFKSELYNPFIDKESFTLVAAGSLYSAKGFDILIKAIGEVCKYLPSIKLYILGGETVELNYKDYLQNLIIGLKLEKHIELVGHVDNPFPYFKKSDLFVLSSIKEGFPNVVLEALSLNTPVVVTNCVNFDGIVGPQNGVVVEKNNINALAEGIQFMYGKKLEFSFENINYDYNKWFYDNIK